MNHLTIQTVAGSYNAFVIRVDDEIIQFREMGFRFWNRELDNVIWSIHRFNPYLAYGLEVTSCSCLFFSALYGGWIVPLKNRIDPKRHRGSFSVVRNFDTAFTGGFTQTHLMPAECAENVLKLSPFGSSPVPSGPVAWSQCLIS